MKCYLALLILSAWLCVWIACAAADPILLVTGNNYHPYTDESLPNGGMSTEIVELAFKEVQYEPKILFRPWKRGYAETKNGFFVGTFPYIKSSERLKDFYFSDPIYTTSTRIFVTQESNIHEAKDLQGKRICVPLGYAVNKQLGDIVGYHKDQDGGNPSDLSGCLHMMRLQRKDFFILDEGAGWGTIQQTFKTRKYFRTLESPFAQASHYLIVAKTYPKAEQIIADFNQGLKQLQEKQLLEAIINRHLNVAQD